MRRSRLARLASGGLLALAVALALPSARAEEPDRSAWLVGRAYERATAFPAPGGATVEAYVAAQEGPAGDAESAWFRFLVVAEGTVGETYAADVTRLADGGARVDLRWEDEGVEADGQRVATALVPADGEWLPAARALLASALAARPDWHAAAERLSQAAGSSDPHERRPLALAAYRALERVHAAHPGHLGLLHDLLVADQLLVPLEVGSDRGANLAFRWREHVHAALVSGEDPGVRRHALTTGLVCALAEGCYAYAALALKQLRAAEASDLEGLEAALARLGQLEHEVFTPMEVTGARGAVGVVVARCNDEPVGDGLMFHRLTFFACPAGRPDAPTPVWYSLTCERTDARTRWTLNGWVGGTRRVLRLFGAEEPDGTPLIEEVFALLGRSVGEEAPR
jgi:hypothetical protein